MDKFKRNFINSGLIFLILCTGYLLCAHEPTDMDISYSALTGIMNITVYHKVNSTSVHYVNLLEIYLNRQGIELEDNLIISQEFMGQPNRSEQRARYIINNLNPGDVLRIVAHCNLFGKLEKSLIISEEKWQGKAEP